MIPGADRKGPTLDRIEQLDWGVYSFFVFLANKTPEIPQLLHVEWAARAGEPFVVAVIVAVALVSLFIQRRWRDALVAILAFALALGTIELTKWIVPRKRPEDARNLIPDADMLGSYPSSSVLLFTLAMVLLGFALWNVMTAVWQKAMFVLVAILLVVWVCMAQFFLALHFLTDILGGLAGAAFFVYLCVQFLKRDETRQTE